MGAVIFSLHLLVSEGIHKNAVGLSAQGASAVYGQSCGGPAVLLYLGGGGGVAGGSPGLLCAICVP